MRKRAWVGVDVGKGFHWALAVGPARERLLSRRVDNDEADLLELVGEVISLAEDVVWAVDQPGGAAALLLALLWERGQEVIYVPGLAVDRARDGYRGESKTDRKDARVIADQARVRGDLGELAPGDEDLAELQLLLARRRDLVADRTPAPSPGSGRRSSPSSRPWSGLLTSTRGARWSWSPATRAPVPSAGRGATGSPPT